MLCIVVLAGLLGCGESMRTLERADLATHPTKAYSVSSYGAKGNGIADDAPAIQMAMQAAAIAGGGKVTFPCGEFALQSPQGVAPGARSLLYLQNVSGVQIMGQGHCTHVFTVLAQKSVFEFANSQQISFTNIRITALNAPYVETYGMNGGAAIRFTGVSYGSIAAVEIDGSSAAAIYFTAGTSHSSAANNFIHNTYGAAIWEDDCGGASAHNCAPSLPSRNNVYSGNTVTDAAFFSYSAISVDDGNGQSNAVIKNNVVSWTRLPTLGNGENSCFGVNNATDVSVLNNFCTMPPWYGIAVSTGVGGRDKNITIQGNTIISAGGSANEGDGIVVYNGPKGNGISEFKIACNAISMATANGITIVDAAKRAYISGGQIVNNTISIVGQRLPRAHFGIDVEYSASIRTQGNQIQCSGTCIAAGVNVIASAASTPKATDNQVIDALPRRVCAHTVAFGRCIH